MGDPTPDPAVGLVVELFKPPGGDGWDLRTAVAAASTAFDVPSTAVWASILDADVPEEYLRVTARDSDDPATQRRCAAASSAYIRELVAQNRHVGTELLDALADDPVAHVRYQVTQNPNTSEATLERLAAGDGYVAFEAAWALRKRRDPELAAKHADNPAAGHTAEQLL